MRCCKRGASCAAALTFGLTFASSVLAAPITPAPVVAAERAFAADGLALGIRDSFLKHAAPEGIVFGPEPVLARAAFQDAAGKDGPSRGGYPVRADGRVGVGRR